MVAAGFPVLPPSPQRAIYKQSFLKKMDAEPFFVSTLQSNMSPTAGTGLYFRRAPLRI